MTLQEAKDLANCLKDYIGKPFSKYIVKEIIPLPDNVELKELTVYIRIYLATRSIDMAAKVTQLEDSSYYLGILSDVEWDGQTTPYFAKLTDFFTL